MAPLEILTAFSRETFIWLAVTLALGGPAAAAAGRAMALAWRGAGRAVFYAAILAAAAGFLCYALFSVPAIPMAAIATALANGEAARAASLLALWAVTAVLLGLFAYAGWSLTRAAMMRGQYGHLGPAGDTAGNAG